jgi:type III pantothenate kinase
MQSEWIIGIDVGNTQTDIALISDKSVIRIGSVPTRPVDCLSEALQQIFSEGVLPDCAASDCLVSSVCRDANQLVKEALDSLGSGVKPCFLGDDLEVGIPIDTENPAEVGKDRLLMAAGARKLFGSPCIVVGVGTAITVDLVDESGTFVGGAIGAGPNLISRALHSETSALPCIYVKPPFKRIGCTTRQAMNSGIYHQCRGGIREIIEVFRKETSSAPQVVVSGGAAPLILPLEVDLTVHHQPDLIFRGMQTTWF